MNKLARNIKKLRKADGLSQEDFAEKVGVTRQTVSKWENDGEIKSTNIDNICKVYNISSEQLMGDNDFKILTVNHETGKTIKGAFSKNESEKEESDITENGANVKFATESKINEDKIKGDNDNRILFQNSKIRNPYIYPIKSKRHKIRKMIKKLIIIALILYILVSLYKFFVICFIIHKQQQYKNVNNYYEEITTCVNNIASEKRKIWYKDESYKIEIIRYDDVGNYKENFIRYFNSNLNEEIIIDKLNNTKKREKINDDYEYLYSNNNFLFYELPELFKENKLYLLNKSFFNFSFKINLFHNKLFLQYDSNKVEIEKDKFLPNYVINNSKLLTEFYYKYEFNSVTDNDVLYEN